MRLTFRLSLGTAVVIAASVATSANGQEFPKDIVRWKPSPDGTVFRGEGNGAWDQKIRERGWILVENGTYHLWYTGYNDAKSPLKLLGHATSPDGIHWKRD